MAYLMVLEVPSKVPAQATLLLKQAFRKASYLRRYIDGGRRTVMKVVRLFLSRINTSTLHVLFPPSPSCKPISLAP